MDLFKKTNRWQPYQRDFLKKHYGKMPTQELAEKLGKTPEQVYSQVHYLKKRGWNI